MQLDKKQKMQKEIGRNIQSLRKIKGKEIKEMAVLLDITPQAYGNIENGKTDICISRIIEIAEILEVNFQQILSIDKVTNYYYTSNNNVGGNNNMNAETLIIDENKKVIELLQNELKLQRIDTEKRLADKDKIIDMLELKKAK